MLKECRVSELLEISSSRTRIYSGCMNAVEVFYLIFVYVREAACLLTFEPVGYVSFVSVVLLLEPQSRFGEKLLEV